MCVHSEVKCTFNFIFMDAELEDVKSLLHPLEKGETVSGVIGYREKTKSGNPKYYLYSLNTEELIVAAEQRNSGRLHFLISKSATLFGKDEWPHLGTVSALDHKFCQISARDISQPGTEVNILKIGFGRKRNDSMERTILLVFQNSEHPDLFIPRTDYGSIAQADPDETRSVTESIGGLPNSRNQILNYILDNCFLLVMTEEDEYRFQVGHPLSVFQGFCIAVAIMTNIY